MRRLLCLLLALSLLLGGCARGNRRYAVTWLDLFDTSITLTGYAPSQSAFDEAAGLARAELETLDAVFDAYAPHEGVNGLWALNEADGAPIEADPALIELLTLCETWRAAYPGGVDVASGALFEVWRSAREQKTGVPDEALLLAAASHRADIRIEGDWISLGDPLARLDLGAVAKGYAAERASRVLEAAMPEFLLDAGGNVRAGAREGGAWTVGVADPRGEGMTARLAVTGLSVVTSGDYQRYFEEDGARYHHIIDPATRYPGGECAQVTVIARDSGLADYLSTTLFLLPADEGRALVDSLDGVECCWVYEGGEAIMSDGFAKYQTGDER